MRVRFDSAEHRNLFFRQILLSDKFKTWKELYRFLGVSRSLFEKYKNGYLLIPYNLYDELEKISNAGKLMEIPKSISIIEDNWGQVKGGNKTYARHKKIFDEGRLMGIAKIRERIQVIDLNIPLNLDLSYIIGLFIGDGFTNKYARYYLIQFIGDKNKENKYYKQIISNILTKLFNLPVKIIEERDTNVIRTNLYSKYLFLLLTERFKIKAGRKSDSVLIPEEIIKSSSDILLECIAGIYDAECCVFWDSRSEYKKPYPRIDLHMHNINLLKQISKIFIHEGIPHSMSSDYQRILIYNENNLGKFLKKVKLRNPKNLERLKHLNLKV